MSYRLREKLNIIRIRWQNVPANAALDSKRTKKIIKQSGGSVMIGNFFTQILLLQFWVYAYHKRKQQTMKTFKILRYFHLRTKTCLLQDKCDKVIDWPSQSPFNALEHFKIISRKRIGLVTIFF